jgi:hypothetical protein
MVSKAQKGYVKGYYITNSGDTVQAKVSSSYKNLKKIKVITLEGKKLKFKPTQIKGFGLLGIEHYRSVPLRNIYTFKPDYFLKVIIDGELALYGVNGVGASSYTYLQRKSFGPKMHQFVSWDFFFKKNMAALVKEDVRLVESIKGGSLRYENLELIVEKFNAFYKNYKNEKLDSVKFNSDSISLKIITPNKRYASIIDSLKGIDGPINHPRHSNYHLGYLVSSNGDTSVRYIWLSNHAKWKRRISTIAIDGNKERKWIKALEISAYGFRDKNFRVIKTGSIWMKGMKFSEVKIDGVICLYNIPEEHQGQIYQSRLSTSYSNRSQYSNSRSYIIDNYYISKKENGVLTRPLPIDEGNYKSILKKLMSDNAEIIQEIESGSYKFVNLSLIITNYNKQHKLKN